MASDHQMAVARTGRVLPPAPLSKSTRQVVPAFLQKLYEMVNDPKNSDLIRWSDAGDSFFVLDHERFAHDVLGRWFKHRNFNSFVRQLNMYGFHKIPHLQQGVLKSDNEKEFWNFAHANFHRGQPDLLCLIQRKKTGNQSAADDIAMDMRESTQSSHPTSSGPSTTQGQVIDVQAIVSGISAIKRHQTTISAELNELKRSNQLLWQDAMAARTRHQKQQDTVNRIVKFLAGVFGHHGTHGKDDTVQSNPPHVVIPRRPARFMIEDAKRDGKGIVEMDDVDTPMTMSEPSPIPSEQTPSEYSSSDQTLPLQQQEPHVATESDDGAGAVTPTRLNPPPIYDFDHRLQGVLNQLSPSQIQQLVNSLASQPLSDPSSSSSSNVNAPPPPQPNSHLTHYTPSPFDFSALNNPGNDVFTLPPTPSEALISFGPFDAHPPPEQVERHWQETDDIDKDVNALDTSIHQLIQTFGFNPNFVDSNGHISAPATDASSSSSLSSSLPLDGGLPPQDFDFDNFFNSLPVDGTGVGGGMDYSDVGSTAFLDEAPSPSVGSGASPNQSLRHLSPEVGVGAGAGQQLGVGGANVKKRKSDVSELDGDGLPLMQQGVSPLVGMQQQQQQGDGAGLPTAKVKKRKEV